MERFFETLLTDIKIKNYETYDYMIDGLSVTWLKFKVIFHLYKVRENIYTLKQRNFSNLQWCNTPISTTESI